MAEPQIPPEVQEQLDHLQSLQGQLGMVQQQRQQIEYQLKELQRAVDGLASIPEDAPVYRTVGTILFKTDGRDAVTGKLGDEKESLEVRLRGFQKQEAQLKEEANELQSKVRAALSNLPAFQGQAN